ncbi:MAG: cbb3-type cytochrome c oxidase subunit I [Phycisphaeraceae bacterium]
MTTPLPTPDLLTRNPLPPGEHLSADNYLNHSRGLWSWLSTLDHKRIALMYMAGILFSFFLGGIFALLIRAELFSPGQNILPQLPDKIISGQMTYHPWQDTYNQVFTLHGAIMVFLFIIPSIPSIFGNFVLPIMLGAKDVAFPKLNLASFYLWAAGAVLFIGAIAVGGLDTGWTFYTPYSIKDSDAVFAGVLPATAGAFILGFSSILTGINFIASIHMLRPAGMTWFKMPLMLWALYATAVIQILATPVLAITLLLLIAERAAGIGIFDPTKGGDPVLYQHFFWFYSHPAVYIMILPAMGVVSEIISVFSRKHIFGYAFIAMSSLAIALLGFLVWGHHMFVSGQSNVASAIFSFFTFFVAIPSAVKVFNWLATMFRGSIWLKSPMLYAMSFIWVFTIGGLTGLFLGALATDVHLTDTYFIVAHFHYVMVGGTVFAFLAAVHYWWPKMFGKMYCETGGILAWFFVFFGFNLTFFPQFIMGSHGMPRRYADWSIDAWKARFPDADLSFISHNIHLFSLCHKLSTIGAFLQLVGFLILAGVLIHSLVKGRLAPRNPWGANSLEWHTSSPPPLENFKHAPLANDPYDFQSWHWNDDLHGFTQHETPEPGGAN